MTKTLLPRAGMGPTPLATQDIALLINGTLIGDPNLVIQRLCHPSDWESDSDLALAMDKSLLPLLKAKPIRAAVISRDAEIEPGLLDVCLIVDRPRLAMAKLTQFFAPMQTEPLTKASATVHPTALIEEGVQLGKNVTIGAYTLVASGTVLGDDVVLSAHVTVGPNCVIGAKTRLRAGVRLGDRIQIGENCLIHQNVVLGSDGFSFVTPEKGSVEAVKAGEGLAATNQHGFERIFSLGAVVIGDDVEIGAGTTIDRGTVAATRIGRGTKIDNQVQIAHNVEIGEDCLICAKVGIAGSTIIGNRVVLGGGTGVADHVRIGDDAMAQAFSGIGSTIPAKTIVAGIPAFPRERTYETHMYLNRLKSLFNQVNDLAARLAKLEPFPKKD